MRIIAKRTLRAYWEGEPRAEQPLKAWYAVARRADWSSPADVKAVYGNASIVRNDRVVFNIGGNRYRLIVRFDYRRRIGFVRFVGTHAEYDRLDASHV
ncbi:MAG: type II toxin-antitoxin system HigB family toxin [Gemmatimonadales bacterium]|nr:type II toxin-antitoxin system HigB family toxin [Gemmatimonadales bacterium]MYG48927.1 type II toxin-antitoxin system HigB family toxin [Gemmatimonadales bacterium]MYK02913.1 type II toxin-antitoxin system HigB family toxin [Candidatus Palauibacter ramosifaciens]